jgi:hypothetical protein
VAERGGSAQAALIVVIALVVVALIVSSFAAGWRPNLPRALRAAGPDVVRVQVVNGCGEGGVASRVASRLRDGGFQVVEVKNAERSDYFASFVVARRDDPAAARSVATYLGGAPVIRQAWGPEPADVTVVLGSDRSRLRLGE